MTRIIYISFAIIVGAIALFLLITVLPISGNYRLLIVRSGSMAPTIGTGSVAVIKPTSNYKLNDIITFKSNFRDAKNQMVPVTHRIIEMRSFKGDDFYITKGDANEDRDVNEIHNSDILGRVVLSLPYVGYLIQSVRTPPGFLILVGIPVVFIFFDQGKKVWKEIKKNRSDEASLQQ